MDCFIRYARILAAVPRTDTVHLIVNETLKKEQGVMEEKRIRWSKEFEEDLPETTFPDLHLRFVLDSILHYAIGFTPPRGCIRIVTKSIVAANGAKKDLKPALDSGGRIEIQVILSDQKLGDTSVHGSTSSPRTGCDNMEINDLAVRPEPVEGRIPDDDLVSREAGIKDAGMASGTPPFKGEGSVPLELRLAGQVVRKNHGVMEFKADERTGKTAILLRIPVERRRLS